MGLQAPGVAKGDRVRAVPGVGGASVRGAVVVEKALRLELIVPPALVEGAVSAVMAVPVALVACVRGR